MDVEGSVTWGATVTYTVGSTFKADFRLPQSIMSSLHINLMAFMISRCLIAGFASSEWNSSMISILTRTSTTQVDNLIAQFDRWIGYSIGCEEPLQDGNIQPFFISRWRCLSQNHRFESSDLHLQTSCNTALRKCRTMVVLPLFGSPTRSRFIILGFWAVR